VPVTEGHKGRTPRLSQLSVRVAHFRSFTSAAVYGVGSSTLPARPSWKRVCEGLRGQGVRSRRGSEVKSFPKLVFTADLTTTRCHSHASADWASPSEQGQKTAGDGCDALSFFVKLLCQCVGTVSTPSKA